MLPTSALLVVIEFVEHRRPLFLAEGGKEAFASPTILTVAACGVSAFAALVDKTTSARVKMTIAKIRQRNTQIIFCTVRNSTFLLRSMFNGVR
jgi:hypothetical protein